MKSHWDFKEESRAKSLIWYTPWALKRTVLPLIILVNSVFTGALYYGHYYSRLGTPSYPTILIKEYVS